MGFFSLFGSMTNFSLLKLEKAMLFSGYCCNTYLPCSDAMSFRFNPGSTAANTKAYSGSSCTEDYIMIEGLISMRSFNICTTIAG